jgi:hypothetical protein
MIGSKQATSLMVFLSLAFALISCQITHRSDDLACTKTTDCSGGKVCDQGFCVGGTGADAPKPPIDGFVVVPDAFVCPTVCDSCDPATKVCKIVCGLNNCNQRDVRCPVGFNCDIQCNGAASCNTIICSGNQNCAIACTGDGSCRNITCGTGRCDVQCTGNGSCRSTDCDAACACSITCSGIGSCSNNIDCPGPGTRCDAATAGCETVPANQCNRC